jgi:hypothetical protein
MRAAQPLAVLTLAVAGTMLAPALAVTHQDGAGRAVSAAFGPDGRLWRVRAGEHSLQVDSSTDLGASFGPPVLIEPPRQRLRVDPEGAPQIAIDTTGTLYIAWTADARDAMQTFLVRSGDAGRTFSAPVSPEVRAPSTGLQLRPLLLAQGDRANFFFLRPGAAGRPGRQSGGMAYRSIVAPAMEPPLAAAPVADSTCECCRLDAAQDVDGSVVLLSRMVFAGGIRDFGIVRIPPAGPASPVLRVTDDDWRIDACPEHGAALAIGPDGRYHLAWFTQGAKRQGLFYASSADRGTTWSAPLRIGTPDALPGHADVLALEGRVFLAWQQFDGTRTSILAMTSIDNGASWTPAAALASTTEAADYPRLLARGPAAFVSWSAGRDGYRLLPVGDTSRPEAGSGVLSFVTGSAAALAARRRNEPFLLVLWSVDCAPCLREFGEFAALRHQGRQLPLVLVATDGPGERERVTAVLNRFGLQDVETWLFTDENAAKLRYEIDPAWYGEMPRSYFYGRDGQRKAVSGGLSAAQVTAWLESGP